MKRIYKFDFEVNGEIVLRMQTGAHILCVQTQHDKPCVWAEVDIDRPIVKRYFRMLVTGQDMPYSVDERLSYVGTFQLRGGHFVGHLYEKVN